MNDIKTTNRLLLVLVIGILELSDSRIFFYPGIFLAILALGTITLNFSSEEETLFLIRMGSLISFFGLLMFHVFFRLFRAEYVTMNLIYAAVAGYILIGLIGGMGFRVINHFYEHSFVFSSGLDAKIDDLTYFSFVTLSSLGYGDIPPVSAPGKSLAILISICGQMYTVVAIGIIIGKYILKKKG